MNRDLFTFVRQLLAVVIVAMVPVVLASFVSSSYVASLHDAPAQLGVARHMS